MRSQKRGFWRLLSCYTSGYLDFLLWLPYMKPTGAPAEFSWPSKKIIKNKSYKNIWKSGPSIQKCAVWSGDFCWVLVVFLVGF